MRTMHRGGALTVGAHHALARLTPGCWRAHLQQRPVWCWTCSACGGVEHSSKSGWWDMPEALDLDETGGPPSSHGGRGRAPCCAWWVEQAHASPGGLRRPRCARHAPIGIVLPPVLAHACDVTAECVDLPVPSPLAWCPASRAGPRHKRGRRLRQPAWAHAWACGLHRARGTGQAPPTVLQRKIEPGCQTVQIRDPGHPQPSGVQEQKLKLTRSRKNRDQRS